jgi:flagellar L-ring protein precursor FlgH
VSENSEVTSDSRFERQRNAQLRAQLRQFIRLDDDLNLRPAAKDSPTIDGQLRSQLQSNGLAKTREGIRYRIAATVVDVLPNGTLILEARKTIRTNEDLWEYALVGKIRGEDVLANNTVLSENIADLGITKTERGKVADSTKRGWFLRIYDALLPF